MLWQPIITNGGGATNVTSDSADLNGYLDSMGGTATADVNVFWGDGEVLTLELGGVLFGERPIEGADCILIKGMRKAHNKADINKDGVVDGIDFAIVAENWLKK